MFDNPIWFLEWGAYTITLATLIQTIPIGGRGCSYGFAWKYDANGVYSVKTGYWEARKLGVGSNVNGPSDVKVLSWWQRLWILVVPNKVKLLL